METEVQKLRDIIRKYHILFEKQGKQITNHEKELKQYQERCAAYELAIAVYEDRIKKLKLNN